MSRRYFFHIDLVDLEDERGRVTLSAGDQADALRYDDDWSALYVDGQYRGRLRTVKAGVERADMVAELRDASAALPPYMQISRFRISRSEQRVALLDKFTIMARPQIDRTEDF